METMPSLPLRSLGGFSEKYIDIHITLNHQALSCVANSALEGGIAVG